MNRTTVLQIPMSKSLRDGAGKAAKEMGFSSLQETIRVFLKQLEERFLTLSFEPKAEQLSPKAIRRYNKIIDEIDSGREPIYETESVDDLLNQLYGRKNTV